MGFFPFNRGNPLVTQNPLYKNYIKTMCFFKKGNIKKKVKILKGIKQKKYLILYLCLI
jgi:hypothetical protein